MLAPPAFDPDAEIPRADQILAPAAGARDDELTPGIGQVAPHLGRHVRDGDVAVLEGGQQGRRQRGDAGNALCQAMHSVFKHLPDQMAVAEPLAALVQTPAKSQQQLDLGQRVT